MNPSGAQTELTSRCTPLDTRPYTYTPHIASHADTWAGAQRTPALPSAYHCLRTPWGLTPPQSPSRRVFPSPFSSPDLSTWSIQVPGDGSRVQGHFIMVGEKEGRHKPLPFIPPLHEALPGLSHKGKNRGGRKGHCPWRGGDATHRGALPNQGGNRTWEGPGAQHTGEAEGHRAWERAHGTRRWDLSVFAQQAHVSLNKGKIFFLCVWGRC